MTDKLRLPDLSGVNRGLRILFIEDSDIDAKIVLDLLKRDRRIEHVDRVGDVDAAMARMEVGAAPDLVITDLDLPGKSGVDFLTELRAQEISNHSFKAGAVEHIPVVVLTDSDRAVDYHQASIADANSFVTKPDNHDELRDLLRRLVRAVIWGRELPAILAPERANHAANPSIA